MLCGSGLRPRRHPSPTRSSRWWSNAPPRHLSPPSASATDGPTSPRTRRQGVPRAVRRGDRDPAAAPLVRRLPHLTPLHQARIITTINKHLGEKLARALRALPVGASSRQAKERDNDAAPVPPTVRPAFDPDAARPDSGTPPTAPRSPGRSSTDPEHLVHSQIARAVTEQTGALRRDREPETAFREALYQQDRPKPKLARVGCHWRSRRKAGARRRLRDRRLRLGKANIDMDARPIFTPRF